MKGLFCYVVSYIAQQVTDISDAHAQQVLQTYGEDFIRLVPIDTVLLFKLETRHVIARKERDEISRCPDKEEKAVKLFDILYQNRTADDFITFCQLLQEHGIRAVQQFGDKLLSEASSSRG